MSRQRGFTLIEVMIALVILSALTVLTSRAIRSGVLNKEKFQGDIAREAAVRDALRVIERDINLAYHYRDINSELMKQAMLESKGTTNPANPPPTNPQDPPPTDPPPVAPGGNNPADPNAPQLSEEELAALKKPTPQWTGFIGQNESIYFSSLSNIRTLRDSPESDQAEIGYFVRDCKSSDGSGRSSKCLMRSVATFIDDDLEKGGEPTILLEHVQEFKLRYLGPGSDEWKNEWVTKTARRQEGVELFPYAVEVYVKTHNTQDKREKPYEMEIVAAIRFPNNDPKIEKAAIEKQ